MTLSKFREALLNDGNDVDFVYNEKSAGISSEFEDGIPTFDMWYGNDVKEFKDFDKMVNEKFFDGKSIVDLIESVVFDFT